MGQVGQLDPSYDEWNHGQTGIQPRPVNNAEIRSRSSLQWTSPFEYVLTGAGAGNAENFRDALSAASEAEHHVMKGFHAAQSWFPNILKALKKHFAVSHYSVSCKLMGLFVPPLGYKYLWNQENVSESVHSQSSRIDMKDMNGLNPSEENINIHHLGFDLYIPLMAFVSYVLLIGITKGKYNQFHPKDLSATATWSLGIVAFEFIMISLSFYMSGLSYLISLDLISISFLKFQSLVVILLLKFWTQSNYILTNIALLYLGICTVHAAYQSLQILEKTNRPQGEWEIYRSPPTTFLYANLLISAIQLPLSYLLSPSIISFHGKGSPSLSML